MDDAVTALSVLTIVKNREAHLVQLVEGLRRSDRPPAELVIVDMSDTPVAHPSAPFPINILRLDTDGLPLAAARNLAARSARAPHLLFLDVDCIPMRGCLGTMAATLEAHDALACADIRYLPDDAARAAWDEADLLATGRSHPVRDFPAHGVRRESNPGLFWSLAFAIRRATFDRIGRFDDGFTGYGAEDTDFGFRADEAGVPLLFVGGAIACHQYHDSFDPPVQHLRDILRNAAMFRARWGWWPMEGWLAAFEEHGLIRRHADRIEPLRAPTSAEIAAMRVVAD